MGKKLFHFTLYLLIGIAITSCTSTSSSIDRNAVVTRNNPHITTVDPLAPLTVGNGEFAFTADVTGLQTFPDFYYQNGIPIETQAEWAWHSFDNPNGYTLKDAYRYYDVHGRQVGYPTNERSKAGQWLRLNPHKLPLIEIGFRYKKADGSELTVKDVKNIDQTLDMWTGLLSSSFTLDNAPVKVLTVSDPNADKVSFKVESPLLKEGKLTVSLRFPFTHNTRIKNKPDVDWNSPDKHTTTILDQTIDHIVLQRDLDTTRFYTQFTWSGSAKLEQADKHAFVLSNASESFEFSCEFSQDKNFATGDIQSVTAASAEAWEAYWFSGGIIDFSECKDTRAKELERRVILSLYLMRNQYCGKIPPSETGLTHSSWYGKHNTEMYWWHAAHFALWDRPELMENSLPWYISIMDHAKATAKERGFEGANWSKMVGPDGRESPGGNPLIIWNQPMPIYMAELIYRQHPTQETLNKYKDMVFETAKFLASFAYWDKDTQRYVLGPPLWLSQEIYDQSKSQNPTFELEYWYFSLKLAQEWKERLGESRVEKWNHVIEHLSQLPTKDGLYVALESTPDTFDNIESRRDHPSLLAVLGVLPGERADKAIMEKTLEQVMKTWDWEAKIWGWDYPMIAMTATRVGRPDIAVKVLLMDAPNNDYTANGHCPQRQDLAVYMPANGSLLSAVALMCAGWDGAETDSPGFPKDGNWNVKWEGISPLP